MIYYNEAENEERTYQEEHGIQSFVSYINRDATPIHDTPIYIEGTSGDIEVEIAFQYTTNYSEQINPYCNRINVADAYSKIRMKTLMEKTSVTALSLLFRSSTLIHSLKVRPRQNLETRMQKRRSMKYSVPKYSII